MKMLVAQLQGGRCLGKVRQISDAAARRAENSLVLSAVDLEKMGMRQVKDQRIAYLGAGKLGEWKEQTLNAVKAALKKKRMIPSGYDVRLVTNAEIARADQEGFRYILFKDKLYVRSDGHLRMYRIMMHSTDQMFPARGFGTTGRPLSVRPTRTINISFKLPDFLEKEMIKRCPESKSANKRIHDFVFEGLQKLRSSAKYGKIEGFRASPEDFGQYSYTSYGLRISQQELSLLEQVRRPGEANQALIRRLLAIALAP